MAEKAPVESENDRLLDHDVDGIHEYDNPLPGWWVNVFVATIVFAVLYVVNVIPGVGSGEGRIANYERAVASAKERRQALAATTAPLGTAEILPLTQDPAALAAGKERFVSTCAPCHRADGGGNIGPNLTDNYWLHGGSPAQIVQTVTNGVVEKGMPAWGPVLKPDDFKAVVAFVLTLRGTTPPNPKAPQGDLMAAAPDTAGATPPPSPGLPGP